MLSLLPSMVSAQNEESVWSMYRPSSYTPINERVQNAATDDEASVGIGVEIVEYFDSTTREPYQGDGGVTLKVAATANTRKGINYQSSWGLGLMDWIEANTPIPGMDPPEDDDVVQVDLPFAVLFYGGLGVQNNSAEYHSVWVSSNGFLSFVSNSPSPNPRGIPDPSEPNTLLAVYWSDLDASQGTIKYYADVDFFAVMWRNVLDKSNGQRQTFEVIISNTRVPSQRGQSKIEFLYESVVWSGSARAGIEDQEGYKGTGLPGTPSSGTSVHFVAANHSPEIRRITIKLQKDDNYAKIYPTISYLSLKGLNIPFESQTPDPEGVFLKAVWGYGTLLVTTFVGILDPVAGFILGAALVTIDLAPDLANALYPTSDEEERGFHFDEALENESIAYISAEGDRATDWGWPVDALLGDQIEWVFTDDNDQDHSVTVTAELEYYSYQTFEIETISTSVDLSVKIGHTLTISAGSGGTTDPAPGTDTYDDGSSVTVTASPNSNYAFDYWILDGATKYANPITVTMNSDHNLKAYFKHTGGGGCPFVYSWNGTAYAIDNNLLGDSEASGGADVEDYYRLEQPLIRKDGKYALLISEFEQEHSYLDQVGLLAVDHESDVHLAVSPDGQILTYKNPYAPVSAIDNHGNSQLNLIEAVDEDYYEGQPGDCVLLDFGSLDISNGAKLVFRANYEFKVKLKCIHVQILDATEGWVDVVAVRTRVHWSTQVVDLSGYLPGANGELTVRLCFTANHKIDYVGLDTTKQEDLNLHHANLVSATHSEEGDVKTELSESDDLYAELVPGEQIELAFTLPENSKDTRTYIIQVEGHYYIIG